MTSLDSSWQASVIKLAQAGNSRAIAFWLNRYLVPQGVCVQVESEPSGGLLICVVCRQTPDCDRLVRFICHRLCKLDSEAIQQVKITAQMVGSSDSLWQKSARLIPPSHRQRRPVSPVLSTTQTATHTAAHTATHTAQEKVAVQTKVKPSTKTVAKTAAKTVPNPELATVVKAAAAPASRPTSPKRSVAQPPRKRQSLQTVQQQVRSLQTASVDWVDRSIRWFGDQKPTTRAVMLGGSAVTAFLVGCSFELMGYYTTPATFQQSKATLTRMLRSASLTSSVKTASERIPVIQQPVLNPDDATVSLIFSNTATLTRLGPGQSVKPNSDGTVPLVTGIENYRLADMLVTSLDNSLGAEAAETAKADTQKPDSTESPQPESSSSETPSDAMVLDQLPPQTEITMHDSEAERAKFAQENPAASTVLEPDKSEPIAKKQVAFSAEELLANGVDVVNVASNAVMPDGIGQLTQTLNLLQQNGIHAVGAGQDPLAARRPQIFNVKGERIAYLGYSDSSVREVTDSGAGVNVSVNQQMEQDIKAIREQVDWVVVSFDWNRELRAYPESWQVDLSHAAIDHGADLVVGYDATVMQGAEVYNGRAIVYSLGSSIDEYSDEPAGNYETAALKVTLKDKIMELEFLPIQVKKGAAEVAKGELSTKIMQYLEQASSLFNHPLRSATKLNSEVRLTLPAAPDAAMPTEPFISYPEASPAEPSPSVP